MGRDGVWVTLPAGAGAVPGLQWYLNGELAHPRAAAASQGVWEHVPSLCYPKPLRMPWAWQRGGQEGGWEGRSGCLGCLGQLLGLNWIFLHLFSTYNTTQGRWEGEGCSGTREVLVKAASPLTAVAGEPLLAASPGSFAIVESTQWEEQQPMPW